MPRKRRDHALVLFRRADADPQRIAKARGRAHVAHHHAGGKQGIKGRLRIREAQQQEIALRGVHATHAGNARQRSAQAGLTAKVAALRPGQALVLDQAYEPLRLSGAPSLDAAALDSVWRLVTPNKALGLTGVRAAYAIAPRDANAELLARVRLLAPSWPLGAHGVALLQAWARDEVHDWLLACRDSLRLWKARQMALLTGIGWQVQPSDANFFVAARACLSSTGGPFDSTAGLDDLRAQGFKLRDCASFGLPGRVRMAVVAPEVQDALVSALLTKAKEAA